MGPKPSQKLGLPCWQAENHAKPQDTEMLLIFRAGICGSLAHRKGTRQGSDIARKWTSEAHHQEQDNTFHKKIRVHTPQDTSSVPALNPGKPLDKATETWQTSMIGQFGLAVPAVPAAASCAPTQPPHWWDKPKNAWLRISTAYQHCNNQNISVLSTLFSS